MQESTKARRSGLTSILILLVLVALSQISFVQAMAQNLYEDASLAISPSAERAYLYGNAHFDATLAADYDIDRAEKLFLKAATENPDLPYVQHQLARIAFLKGNFPEARARIDREIEKNPTPSPSSYYIRGLIEGFAGDYAAAAKDYETYLRTDSKNWAAINDYAWVLLKAGRSQDALIALDWGLIYFPDNPWLLNSKATALFEMQRHERAKEAIDHAAAVVANLTEAEWLQAYPGNDPLIAAQGVAAFKDAVAENMHTISLALDNAQKDVR